MERESAVLKHGTVVQPFIKDAFKEGAHRIKPKTSQNRWFRQMMIGVVYNDIGSTATLEELADKHRTFRQSIALSNKIFLRNLWNNSSSQIQERYPLNEVLSARKPLSQRSRERFSEVQGGTSLRIREQVESGVADPDKISLNTGISKENARKAASGTLKGWGINVPRERASYKEALEYLEEETDDKKVQELLDGLPYHVIRDRTSKEKGISQFRALANFARQVEFHLHTKDTHLFAASLRNAGVPISIKDVAVGGAKPRINTYYILLSRHKDRAEKVLKEDQALQRFQRVSS